MCRVRFSVKSKPVRTLTAANDNNNNNAIIIIIIYRRRGAREKDAFHGNDARKTVVKVCDVFGRTDVGRTTGDRPTGQNETANKSGRFRIVRARALYVRV